MYFCVTKPKKPKKPKFYVYFWVTKPPKKSQTPPKAATVDWTRSFAGDKIRKLPTVQAILKQQEIPLSQDELYTQAVLNGFDAWNRH